MAAVSTSLVLLNSQSIQRVLVKEQFSQGLVAASSAPSVHRVGFGRQHDAGKLERPARIIGQAGRRHHRRRDEHFQSTFSRKDERMKGRQEPAEEKVVITIDMAELRERLWRAGQDTKKLVGRTAEMLVESGHSIVDDGCRVLRDLRTSVAVQNNARLVVAVRRSSLVFGIRAILWSVFVIAAVKLFLSAARRFRWGWEEGNSWSRSSKSVVRDRSLGGREVVLKSRNPLDVVSVSRSEKDMVRPRKAPLQQVKKETRLPGWWPSADVPLFTASSVRRSPAQGQAQALVEGMMKKRIGGQDFMEDDILELRRLCRDSGATVTFDTTNGRDSFYRIAINYVLSATSRLGTGLSSLELGNEDATKFVAGLAGHIGLDAKRAANMVDAAVAARTRAGFLQAWALLKQKSMDECEGELLKLVRIHSCFPPDLNSPEMELVARGLTAYLPEEQRKCLLEKYVACGGDETRFVAEEALGLVSALR